MNWHTGVSGPRIPAALVASFGRAFARVRLQVMHVVDTPPDRVGLTDLWCEATGVIGGNVCREIAALTGQEPGHDRSGVFERLQADVERGSALRGRPDVNGVGAKDRGAWSGPEFASAATGGKDTHGAAEDAVGQRAVDEVIATDEI